MFFVLIRPYILQGGLFYLVLLGFFVSCQNSKTKKYLPKSGGGINSITLVGDQTLLDSDFGILVKDSLRREVKGLPVVEPSFDVSTLSFKVFSGFARQSRNIIFIKKDTTTTFFIKRNVFAKPQIVFNLYGENEEDLSQLFKKKLPLIIDSISVNEEREKTKRILLSPNKENALKDLLGINLTMPSVFFIGKPRSKNLFWATRRVKNGISNLVIYDIPSTLVDSTNLVSLKHSILKIRDSIGQNHIPGPKPGMYYAIPSKLPYTFKKIKINGHTSYETRGLWVVTNFTMGGPFINYFVEDHKHKRYIVIEGFVFAPRELKRNYIFELQTIAKSIKFL